MCPSENQTPSIIEAIMFFPLGCSPSHNTAAPPKYNASLPSPRPSSPPSSAAVRSHHVPSASENYNHHHNNHSAPGCGQHYHHNRAQGGQQGSAQAASCDPADYFPSTPGVLPFTWALLRGHREERHHVASDPEGNARGATVPQGNAR